MKLLIYGFGAFPLFFKPLVELARKRQLDIDWYAILPTRHHLLMMTKLLGPNNVLYLHDELSQMMKNPLDLSVLVNYPGSLYSELETDKITIKKRPAKRQLANGLATYNIYKRFLEATRPSYILFGHLETHDGMILRSIARELGIGTIFPVHTRNLKESFFSCEHTEVLPLYTSLNENKESKAQKFIRQFRTQPIPPNDYSIASTDHEEIKYSFSSLPKRTINYLQQLIYEKENRSLAQLRVRLLSNMPVYRDGVRGIRKYINSKIYDIDRMLDLPSKYIYYPLQYTPESSINIPAPYFIDQKRAIDAIRFSMPSDTLLVIKEHPACINVRPISFLRSLKKCPGVVIANYKMSSIDLVKKSQLTISVTGTATLEAFLLGKSSITLGDTFFSEFLGGKCGIEELPIKIKEKLGRNIPDDIVVDAVTKIFSVSNPFILRSPGETNSTTMVKKNIEVFLNALLTHIEKMENNNENKNE